MEDNNINKIMNLDKGELLKFIISKDRERIKDALDNDFKGILNSYLVLYQPENLLTLLNEFDITLDTADKINVFFNTGIGFHPVVIENLSEKNKESICKYIGQLSSDERGGLINKLYYKRNYMFIVGASKISALREDIIKSLSVDNLRYIYGIEGVKAIMDSVEYYPIDLISTKIKDMWCSLGSDSVTSKEIDVYRGFLEVLDEVGREVIIAESLHHKQGGGLGAVLKLINKTKNNYQPKYHPLWKNIGYPISYRAMKDVLTSPGLELSDVQDKSIDDFNVISDSFFGALVGGDVFNKLRMNRSAEAVDLLDQIVKNDNRRIYKKEVYKGKTLFDLFIDNIIKNSNTTHLNALKNNYKQVGLIDQTLQLKFCHYMSRCKGNESASDYIDMTWLKKDNNGVLNIVKYIKEGRGDFNVVLVGQAIGDLPINKKKEFFFCCVNLVQDLIKNQNNKEDNKHLKGIILSFEKIAENVLPEICIKGGKLSSNDVLEMNKMIEINEYCKKEGINFDVSGLDYLYLSQKTLVTKNDNRRRMKM